jgi:D-alanyl-D-alanine carboxypeptidase
MISLRAVPGGRVGLLLSRQVRGEEVIMPSSGRLLRAGLALTVLLAGGCTSDGGNTPSPTISGVVTSTSANRFPDPATTPFPAAEAAALNGILAGVVSDYALSPSAGAPGITAAALSDHGSWTGAAGTAGDGKPLRPDSMMSIASITKTFTAAEVMMLAVRGKVNLDAPMSTYVRHPLTANGATVRQALSMLGGLTDPPRAVFRAMIAAQAATPGKHWTARETLDYLKPRSSAPGAALVYADTSYLLLGLLIEKVTGMTVAQAERADLFIPAGLKRVAAQDAERPTPPLAAPARAVNAADGYVPSRLLAHWGADSAEGIAADAATVARWGYQLYGARLLPDESVQAMTTQPSDASIRPSIGYGLGTMVFLGLSTDVTVGHSGGDPGYTTFLAVSPARHLAVALLIPQENRETYTIMRNLLEALT